MLIDFLQFMFNLIIALFVLRYAQMMIKDGPTDSAIAWLIH